MMKKAISLFCAALLIAVALSATSTSQTPDSKTGAGSASALARGRRLFQRNCASCHGLDGKGGGLVADALRKRPPDLTAIPRKNGRFPSEEVVMTITGALSLRVHGTREMPVWGGVLKNSEILSLVTYIESIQNSWPKPPATGDGR